MFHSWKKPELLKVRWAGSLFKSNSWWHLSDLSGTSFTVYDLWKQGLHCLVRPMLVHSWDPQDASCEVHAGFAYWLSDLSDVLLFFQRFQPSRTSRCWMCLPNDASATLLVTAYTPYFGHRSDEHRLLRGHSAINFNVIQYLKSPGVNMWSCCWNNWNKGWRTCWTRTNLVGPDSKFLCCMMFCHLISLWHQGPSCNGTDTSCKTCQSAS